MRILWLSALLVLFSMLAVADPITALYIHGTPNSWVAGNQTLILTPDDGFVFEAQLGYAKYYSPQGSLVYIFVDTRAPQLKGPWSIFFAAPANQILTTGEYQNATRAAFEDPASPGLDFYGDGRGDNRLTGSFNVLQLVTNNGQIISFAADFIQFDENRIDAISEGSIRYNSNIPLTTVTPEPTSFALLLLGLTSSALAARKQLRRFAVVAPPSDSKYRERCLSQTRR